jgi:hypothetical protein
MSYIIILQPILGRIAYNVPAVYEGFYGAIKKCVAFCAIKTLGKVERGRRSRPSETEPRGALAPKRIQTCYVQLGRTPFYFL